LKAGKWKANGARGSYRRTISWDELERCKAGELPVGSPSAIDGATWSRPLGLAADTEVNKVAAEAIRARSPLPDGCDGLLDLARDPVLVGVFREYHDRKVDRPNSLVLDLWLVKGLYDAGYELRDGGAGISLPLTGGARKATFVEAVRRVFMNVVYAKLVTKAQRFLSRSNLAVPLVSRKLAGTERLLTYHEQVYKFLNSLRYKIRGQPDLGLQASVETHSHAVEEAIIKAADRYDPNIPKYGSRRAKFTSFLYWSAKTTRFLNRDVLARAKSLDAPIKRETYDGGDKQQTLIDLYEDRPEQSALDVYGDTVGADMSHEETSAPINEIVERAGLTERERQILDNELSDRPLSGKAQAEQMGVSEPRRTQLKQGMLRKLQENKF
jgi:hypothetical protein